jgi:two-component system sensor histidine kinase DesK
LIEWSWTLLSFGVFLAFAFVGAVYWSRPRVMIWACAAMLALAVSFTSYRPHGVIYFIYAAAYVPLACTGRPVTALLLVATVAATALLLWWLLWPFAPMPFVVALEALLIGAAITSVAKEQHQLRNALKSMEQDRIARDLHDVLGHTLSVIVLKSEVANRLADTDWQRAKKEMKEVESLARQTLSEVRDAITGVRAGNLHTEMANARTALQAADIRVEEGVGEIALPTDVARTLSLVLREAVTNVIRHAQATQCRLSLVEDGGVLQMQVRDNGRGHVGPEGFGVRSIRRRISEIGGSAQWRHDEGTELTITVPLKIRSRS